MKKEIVKLIQEFKTYCETEHKRLYDYWYKFGTGEDDRPETSHLEFTFENFYEWLLISNN